MSEFYSSAHLHILLGWLDQSVKDG